MIRRWFCWNCKKALGVSTLANAAANARDRDRSANAIGAAHWGRHRQAMTHAIA
jgi:hypothetical protein